MQKILLTSDISNPNEHRLAVLENGTLTDFVSFVKGREDRKNNIYAGVVAELAPSLDACFVNIGSGKNGFLPFSEIDESCLPEESNDKPIAERIGKGTRLLVQISKEGHQQQKKGPSLTTRLKLIANDLVLMPREKEKNGYSVTKKADNEEREKFLKAREEFEIPEGMSLIVRSNALDKSVTELVREFQNRLLPFWSKILDVFEQVEKPTLIYEYSNIINKCVMEYMNTNTEKIVCDDETTATDLKAMLKAIDIPMADKVEYIDGKNSLYKENLLKDMHGLIDRRVPLKSGGELVIDVAEAFIAIDVNSKRSKGTKDSETTAVQTNLEAANEIARQLKLRDMAGLIVIDFIDMRSPDNRAKVETQLRRAFRSDRAKITTGRISKFGLLEMTRENIGLPFHEIHSEICEKCNGYGRLPKTASFATMILEKIEDTCVNKQVASMQIWMPIEPAAFVLNEYRDKLTELKQNLGIDITIIPSALYQLPDFKIQTSRSKRNDRKFSYNTAVLSKPETQTYKKDSTPSGKKDTPVITGMEVTESGEPKNGKTADTPPDQAQEPQAESETGTAPSSGGDDGKPSEETLPDVAPAEETPKKKPSFMERFRNRRRGSRTQGDETAKLDPEATPPPASESDAGPERPDNQQETADIRGAKDKQENGEGAKDKQENGGDGKTPPVAARTRKPRPERASVDRLPDKPGQPIDIAAADDGMLKGWLEDTSSRSKPYQPPVEKAKSDPEKDSDMGRGSVPAARPRDRGNTIRKA